MPSDFSSGSSVPRYVTGRSLPAYSYVSGQWPHPFSNPAGHSYGHVAQAISQLPADEEWLTAEEYLFAVDLWNHGYYWEAHETWESFWRAAGFQNSRVDFFKALIKLAAAGVKLREGRPSGAIKHLTRAAELLDSVNRSISSGRSYWGLALPEIISLVSRLRQRPYAVELTAVVPVLRVWPELLILNVH